MSHLFILFSLLVLVNLVNELIESQGLSGKIHHVFIPKDCKVIKATPVPVPALFEFNHGLGADS